MENENPNDPLVPAGAPEFLRDIPKPTGDDLQIISWVCVRCRDGIIDYREKPLSTIVPGGMIGDQAGSVRKIILGMFDGMVVSPFMRLINILTEQPGAVQSMLYVPPTPKPIAPPKPELEHCHPEDGCPDI